MLQENLPPFLYEFLLRADLVTILQRVQISPLLVDSMYVGATPRAASLFGYENPEEFIGTWHSKTMTLQEFRKLFDLSLCRHFNHEIPHRYITNILRPNGALIPVVKDTKELFYRHDIYWITHLTPVSALSDAERDFPHIADLKVPETVERYRDFGGLLSVAEVEILLTHHAAGDRRLTERQVLSIISSVSRQIIPRSGKQQTPSARPVLVLGRPITVLPHNGQVLFECQHCGWIWTSKQTRQIPQRCSNPNRRCYDWRVVRSQEEDTPSEQSQTAAHVL